MEEMDMMKMMEQAAALSRMMNPDDGKAPEDGFQKVAAMLEVMKRIQAVQPSPTPAPPKSGRPPGETPPPSAFYDDPIYTPPMRAMKAAIPHLDYKYQKNLGIMIKLLEIQRLLELYNARVVAMGEQNGSNWRRDMLQAIRPHVPVEKQSMLDTLIKMLDMKEIMETLGRNGA